MNNEPDIIPVWITKNNKVYNDLKSKNYNVYLWPQKKAKQIVGKAKFIFQTEGNRDTGEYRVGGATIVQLWHGIAPKKMEWHKNYSALKKFLITIYGDNHKKSFWCTASKYNLENIANIFNIPPNNIVITGYPRNDILIDYDLKKLPEIFKNNKGMFKCHISTDTP